MSDERKIKVSGADILGTCDQVEQRWGFAPLICKDEGDARECEAAKIVAEVARRGALVYFEKNQKQNCHASAAGVLTMVAKAGLAAPGWEFVQGDTKNFGWHSWCEFDGWAVDFSNGRQFFAPTDVYYKLIRAKVRRRFKPNTVAEMLRTRKGIERIYEGK